MKKIEVTAGSCIKDAIEKAIEAAKSDGPVEFDFNGVAVRVAEDSDPKPIYRDWSRSLLRPSGTFAVGPYPPRLLSDEQLAEDTRLRDEQRARERKAREAQRERQKRAETVLKDALSSAPFLSLRDKEGWLKTVEANTDPYGACAVRFAENWGRLMQARIEKGERLEDVADECCSVANGPEGITGFMYGCAVSVLSQVWEHGETLRRWHNLKTQLKDEGERANESGGVLNPALLSLG